jgi:adenosylmethionine-8-amino-7-oxononanoate aminotransferase
MDLESGVWCASIGHNNGWVNQAMSNQSKALMHGGFCYSSQVVEEEEIYSELISDGYLVGNRGGTLRIDPPLIITESEFEAFIDAFRTISGRIQKTHPSQFKNEWAERKKTWLTRTNGRTIFSI